MASSRMLDHIGRVLGGRYRLIAPIGTGASAHVFLADDVTLRRRVAVKVLHPALADDEAFLRRFRAEAQAAAALNHPHIMAVYDWGEEGDGPYLVSEYLGGGSLRSMLDRGRKLSISQTLMVGLEAARGLDYAHRRGLVHRDIKPANLLFDDDGRLRIADFGLARALAEAACTEPTGAVLGTARYASPEQVRGSSVDGKADVYSLAVVLVEAATGRVPFAADTTVATLMGRLDRPIDAPPEMGALGAVVARAGRNMVSERLDAAALGAALQAVAPELPSPEPLPLAGPAVFDEAATLDPDPTELGGGRGPRKAATVAPPVRAGLTRPASADPADMAATDPTVALAAGAVAATGGADPTVAVPVPAAPAGGDSGPSLFDQSQVDEPLRAGRRRRRWPVVLLVVLVLAGAGAGGGYALTARNRVPSHLVPNQLQRPEADAAAALRALEFKVRVNPEFSESAPAGVVTAQNPPSGKLKEGKLVTLTVSAGPPPVAVPDLAGLSDAEAKQRLIGAGLVVGAVTPRHDEQVAANKVLDWSLKGQQPPKGTAVDLAVSAGPAPRVIPDVAGRTYEQAAASMAARQLQAQKAEEFNDADAGAVVGTSPKAGSSVARGATVTIVVSKGQPVVPKLAGMTKDQASAALAGVGLKLGNVYGPGGGKVFLTVPSAGTKSKAGSPVDIFIV